MRPLIYALAVFIAANAAVLGVIWLRWWRQDRRRRRLRLVDRERQNLELERALRGLGLTYRDTEAEAP